MQECGHGMIIINLFYEFIKILTRDRKVSKRKVFSPKIAPLELTLPQCLCAHPHNFLSETSQAATTTGEQCPKSVNTLVGNNELDVA